MAYWLIPEEPVCASLSAQINELASRYSSVPFSPHVTIYSCYRSSQQPDTAVARKIARQTAPLCLTVGDLACSAQMKKALYVELVNSTALASLHQKIHQAVSCPSSYELDPHLSLLYQQLNAVQQGDLLNDTNITLETITFNQLWVVAIPEQLDVLDDFRGWQTLAQCQLATGQNIGTL